MGKYVNNKCSSLYNITLCAIVLMGSLAGCKKDEPTAQEQVTKMLTSAEAWQDPIVTVDDVDQSALYTDFVISFSNTNYTSANGSPVWKSAGTWVFKDEMAQIMIFDGVQEVEITSISNEELELSVQWNEDTFEPGRTRSVKGKNKFKLKKKPKK
ncbi:MAG: hypothetical protein AB7O48_02280 [Cyclobacteriaceae bacterium]